ncbi:MFS transporter [Nocardioides sp. ChNu-153]|uniref:MFS transporter n=1 Tax=unclassified Nocardioides TaxID=2615069 RepID=UPI002404DC2B|nr:MULTISPECIES: MFS transporter [unclassified Nocardioides]MDF9716007.1 MFS transporter [Nocardioides sp. ChNu-99]MDN7119975.1 MFS transporter [Nocardioides sp. ChNu-153]
MPDPTSSPAAAAGSDAPSTDAPGVSPWPALWAMVIGSGLLLVPMALATGFLAPVVGRLVDRAHPRSITVVGFVASALALLGLSRVMTTDSPVWQVLLPLALFGVGSAFLWAPLSATATRNLPLPSAGAGSGVYNTTRQVGAVLGSAAVAALIQARLAANLPGATGSAEEMQAGGGTVPAEVAGRFSDAMAQAVLLPAGALGLGVLVVLLFAAPRHDGHGQRR